MKKKILTYPTSQRGKLNLNLNENRLNFFHLDFNSTNGNIPISISHVYQNNGIDKGYGKGFNINLDQTISKIFDTSKYVLTLADGSEEIFEEVYYYKDENDKKIYKTDIGTKFKRRDITLSLDGTLKYNDHLIYVDLKTDTGFTLRSDYKDFIDSDKIELRHEDLVSLTEEIRQLEGSIEDLEYNRNEYARLSNTKYLAMIKAQDELESLSKDINDSEVLQYKEDEDLNTQYYNKKSEYQDLAKKEPIETFGVTTREEFDQGNLVTVYTPGMVLKYMPTNYSARVAESEKRYDYYFEKIQDNNSRYDLLTDSAKKAEYYEQQYTFEIDKINQELEVLSKELEEKNRKNQAALYELKEKYNKKNTVYLNAKKDYEDEYNKTLSEYYKKLDTRAFIQIRSYKNLKASKEYQRKELIKQIPELFLYKEDGVVYGYNTFGKLCYIFDAYENHATIYYNDRNQLKEILYSNNQKIEFIYNGKNQLIRIIDEKDNYIDYEYEGDFLKKICYQNKDVFTLNYSEENLVDIIDIDSIGYKLDYTNDLLSGLKLISFETNKIDEDLSFSYLENQVTITDNMNGLQTNYLFDESNSLTTEYIVKEGEIDEIATYEYESDHCSFSMHTNKKHRQLFSLGNDSMLGIRTYKGLRPNSYSSDYMLYALVEADSLNTIRKGRKTAYCSHEESDSNVYFELRCELTYDNYKKTYYSSFNPSIKGKQFLALPITFDEDSQGNVLIPKDIVSFMDYRNNNEKCMIHKIALVQGDYIYCEYDEAHHKIHESFSETCTIQAELFEKKQKMVQKNEIDYSYNSKDLLEEETLKTRTLIYDNDDMIVHNDKAEAVTSYCYNKQGKLLKEQDSNGKVCEYVYDSQGACIQKKNYHISMPNEAYIEEVEYDTNGAVLKETNELGYKKEYTYLNDSLASVTTPNGNILYTHSSNKANALSAEVNGQSNYNNCVYEKGRLIEYQAEGMNYRYTYDEFGREKELFINDKLYCSFSLEKSGTTISYTTLFNDNTGYRKTTDQYGKTLEVGKISHNQYCPCITYSYDRSDRMYQEVHHLEQTEVIGYNYIDDTLVASATKDYTKYFNQELHNSNIIYKMGDIFYGNKTTCDDFAKAIKYSYSVNDTVSFEENYTYDKLDRIKEVDNTIIKNKYTYLSKNGRTTNLISSLQKNIKDVQQRYNYTYDKEGNITHKKENHKSTRYIYDNLNRLIREDNEEYNQTILYSYDSNGNIQTKEIYDYTQTDNLENKSIIEYNYNDFNDYLTKFNGREIKYDSLGNPTIYKDIPLVWNQRELKKYGDIEYSYNINHIRTQKKTSDKAVEYILDGTRILKEKRKYYPTRLESYIEEGLYIDTYEEEIEYIYSNQGIIGFDHIKDGTKKRYYYNKNISGDILEIYDEESNLVGKYTYDAYGNHRILINKDDIANINPIRYRSYYFDIETGLYLVTTRYYNPEWCRFISPDSIEYLDPSSINGMNLYAYCYNNPVNYVDPDGHMPKWLQGLAIGLAVVGAILVVGAITALTMGVGTTIMATTMAGAVIHGAAIGTLIGAGIGVVAGGIIGGATTNWSAEGILVGMGIGFGGGAIIGAIAGGSVGAFQYTSAVSQWGSAGGRTAQENMIHHFNKHVIGDGHSYLGKNVIQYTKNASNFFKSNSALMKLTSSGNYVIRASFAGHSAGGFFDLAGIIFSFF
ncbi:MAG: hypothetical protein K2M08_05310 [Anaeroplasmataceae bacterium]|nr:hypothetical protein [Anaeroplasmataceae bacterium]